MTNAIMQNEYCLPLRRRKGVKDYGVMYSCFSNS